MVTKKTTKKTTVKEGRKKKIERKKVELKNNEKTEQFKIYGHELLEKVKEIIKEGNASKIIIKNDKGKTMLEIPVTFAVFGTVVSPVLAAVGAFAALMTKCTIEVERK